MLVEKLMQDDVPEVVRSVVAAAKEGDMQARRRRSSTALMPCC